MQITSKMKGKAFFGRIVVAVVFIMLLTLLLLKSPLLDPVVSIQTKDFPAQQSQLFYKSGGSYSEKNSKVSKLRQSDQTFRFSLPVYDDLLRWDPLERSGRFVIESVTINNLGYKIVVASNEVSAALQIEKISGESTVLQFVVPEGAKDPQIIIHINSKHLDRIRLLIAITIAVFTFVLVVICAVFRDQVRLWAARWRVYLNCLKRCLSKEYFTPAEFLSFLGIGVFLNIVPSVNFFLSVDDEAGAIRMDPSVWIADGRWTAFLVERFIFPQPVLPFVPNLFFYVCLAVSYMFLLRTYKLKFYWVTILAYCVFVAHPIWWFIGEFYSNIPSAGVGILALCLALYIISKIDLASTSNKAKLALVISSSVFLSVAIGAYQSLVMFYLVGGMAAILFGCTATSAENSVEVKLILKKLAILIVVLLVGLVFYQAINEFARFVYPSSRGYIDSFLRIDELFADPMRIFRLVMKEMWELYSGSIKSYGVSFFSSAIMLGLAIMFLVSKKTWSGAAISIMCICGMLLSPFLLHFVTGAVYLPLRSMLAISLVVCVAVIIVLERGGVFRVPGIVLSIVLLFQMISVNGLYSANTILATTHDRLTAEALHLRMAALHPLIEANAPIYVDIYGKLSFTTSYPAPDSSTMGASFFNWDGGNANRMLTYMRVIGLGNVYALQREKSVSLTPEFDDMPIWPAEGSVRYKDGMYLIRLSDEPDPVHAKYSNGDVIK